MDATHKTTTGSSVLRRTLRPGWPRTLFIIACLITLVALFYAVENWKGKRAWDKCKRELTAKGAVLEWEPYIPPSVPDDKNIYKAPQMTEWFVNDPGATPSTQGKPPSNRFKAKLSTDAQFFNERNALAVVNVVRLGGNTPSGEADLVLRYEDSVLSLGADAGKPAGQVMPLVQVEDVPLTTAITNLARYAGIAFTFDPKISFGPPYAKGKPAPPPHVSLRLENATAKQALTALLDWNGLQLIANPTTGVATIANRNENKPAVVVPPDTINPLRSVVTSRRMTNAPGELTLTGAALNQLVARDPSRKQPQPAQLVIGADRDPTAREVAALFSQIKPPVSVTETGTNQFLVSDMYPEAISARDYLDWSNRLQDELDIIRTALQRPDARIDGDYQPQPFASPRVNFVALRQLAHTLAQRAQCFLLLGQPDEALQELTLLNDARRLLKGQPRFLVNAMIDVALVGVFQSVIADGLQLGQWQESHLIALQKHLENVDTLSALVAAMHCEAAASCQTLQWARGLPIREIQAQMGFKAARGLLVANAPRGWLYQNMVTVATLEHEVTEGFNTAEQIVYPNRLNKTGDRAESILRRPSVYALFAAMAVPGFRKVAQNTALQQIRVNQTITACALERYRAAHNEYPATLEALSPRFLEAIPHDIIGGRPLKYQRTKDGFQLYSIGWNETDEGGKPSQSREKEDGDWVWAAR